MTRRRRRGGPCNGTRRTMRRRARRRRARRSRVLRAVLANSPNSIPPERVFSILNDTFEDDMERSLADYIELALQLQFNGHSRE